MNPLATTLSIIFWFVVILIPLVVIHEFGHLLMARLTQTRVPEFGVGIPPRVAGRRWKGILWSLNAIPLGGFVRIYGDGDAADNAVDALQTLAVTPTDVVADESSHTSKKIQQQKIKDQALASREEIKQNYIQERLIELIQNRELDYFLQQNGLELTSEWQTQLKADKLDTAKEDQLKTLIGWEFEGLEQSKDAFYNKPYWAKLIIMLGGITTNFIFAFGVILILLAFFQVPGTIIPGRFANSTSLVKTAVSNELTLIVSPQSLAEQQGLKTEDKIVSMNNQEFSSPEAFMARLRELGGTDINLKIRHKDGSLEDKKFTIPVKDGDKPQLGVEPIQNYTYRANSFWDAIPAALNIIWNFSILIFVLLGKIIQALFNIGDRAVLGFVGGPVAIGNQGSQIFSTSGFEGIMTALALVSVNLGVFNLLPVPALDGGRVVMLTLQKITGKRNRKLEYSVISFTFIVLIILGIAVAIKDIRQIANF